MLNNAKTTHILSLDKKRPPPMFICLCGKYLSRPYFVLTCFACASNVLTINFVGEKS